MAKSFTEQFNSLGFNSDYFLNTVHDTSISLGEGIDTKQTEQGVPISAWNRSSEFIYDTDSILEGAGELAELDKVDTQHFVNDSVTTAKIKDNTIRTDDILNSQVKQYDIASNAITSDKIQNGSVTEDKIVDEAISARKLTGTATASNMNTYWNEDFNVSLLDINTSKFSESQITDRSIDYTDIANNSVANANFKDNDLNTTNPIFDTTGVSAGTYTTITNIQTDSKGRVTSISGS